MNRWLRVVFHNWLPALVFALLLKAIFIAPGVYVYWVTGQPEELANRPSVMLFFLVLGGYAIHRVAEFHPVFQSEYRRWLLLTPWTHRAPLPLGPIHLLWQDVVIVAVLTGLACWPEMFASDRLRPVWLVQTFVVCYLFSLGASLRVTGTWRWAYAVGLAFGLLVRLWHLPIFFFAAAAGTYALAYLGLQRSLAEFPWNLERLEAIKQLRNRQGPVAESPSLGWPFEQLSPKETEKYLVPHVESFCLAGLAAWWLHVALSMIPDTTVRVVLAAGAMVFAMFALIPMRILFYVSGHYSTLSLLGRLFTGRLIIPGFDKIFIAPALAMLVYSIGMVSLVVNPVVIAPLTIFVVVAIVFGAGPSLRDWRLTGAHHIVIGAKQGLERVG